MFCPVYCNQQPLRWRGLPLLCDCLAESICRVGLFPAEPLAQPPSDLRHQTMQSACSIWQTYIWLSENLPLLKSKRTVACSIDRHGCLAAHTAD